MIFILEKNQIKVYNLSKVLLSGGQIKRQLSHIITDNL